MNFPFRLATALLAVVLLAPASALADKAGERPPVLKALERHGLTVLEEFPGPPNLRAFAAMSNAQAVAVYVAADGSAIVGTRIDAAGAEADADKLKELALKPVGDKIWADLQASTWIRDGKPDAPRIVYTFSDPNCPYCNRFWHAARPWIDAGKVQLRHVMVGVIRKDSPNKAAAMLTAKDPSAALLENESNFKQGGIKPADTIPASIAEKLDANRRLMGQLGFQGTPATVSRDADGIVQRRSGMPQGPELESVLGPRP